MGEKGLFLFIEYMRRIIYKFVNIALIFTLIEALVCQGYCYAWDLSLRVPSSFQKKDLSLGERFKIMAGLSGKSESFYKGLGEIVWTDGVSGETALLLKEATEDIISQVPGLSIEDIYANSLIDNVFIKITVEPHQKKSFVNKTDKEVNLLIGKDILYRDDKIESILLSEMISELLAAFILDDYVELKRLSGINENAYFKLEIIKGLLNYKNYPSLFYKIIHISEGNWQEEHYLSEISPQDQEHILEDLRIAIRDWKFIDRLGLYSYLFDEIISDPQFSPALMVLYYVHAVVKNGIMAEEDIASLVNSISRVQLKNRPSIAGIRNLIKDFITSEIYYVRIEDSLVPRRHWPCFDNSEDMLRLKRALHTTKDEQEFYESFENLLEISLNLEDRYIKEEMGRFIEEDIFSIPASYEGPRAAPIRKSIEEILNRRVGRAAYQSFTSYILGNKDIIYYPEFNLGKLSRQNKVDNYFSRHDSSSPDFYDRTKEFFSIPRVNPAIAFQYIKDMGMANAKDLIRKMSKIEGGYFIRPTVYTELSILIRQGMVEEIEEKKGYYKVTDIAKNMHYEEIVFFSSRGSLLNVGRLMKELGVDI